MLKIRRDEIVEQFNDNRKKALFNGLIRQSSASSLHNLNEFEETSMIYKSLKTEGCTLPWESYSNLESYNGSKDVTREELWIRCRRMQMLASTYKKRFRELESKNVASDDVKNSLQRSLLNNYSSLQSSFKKLTTLQNDIINLSISSHPIIPDKNTTSHDSLSNDICLTNGDPSDKLNLSHGERYEMPEKMPEALIDELQKENVTFRELLDNLSVHLELDQTKNVNVVNSREKSLSSSTERWTVHSTSSNDVERMENSHMKMHQLQMLCDSLKQELHEKEMLFASQIRHIETTHNAEMDAICKDYESIEENWKLQKTSLEEALLVAEQQFQTLSKENIKLRSEMNSYAQMKTTLQNELSSYREITEEQCNELEKQLVEEKEAFNTQQTKYETQLARYQTDLKTLTEKVQRLKVKKGEYSEAVSILVSQVSVLEESERKLLVERNALQIRLGQVEGLNEENSCDRSLLLEKMADMEAELVEVNRQLWTCQLENSSLRRDSPVGHRGLEHEEYLERHTFTSEYNSPTRMYGSREDCTQKMQFKDILLGNIRNIHTLREELKDLAKFHQMQTRHELQNFLEEIHRVCHESSNMVETTAQSSSCALLTDEKSSSDSVLFVKEIHILSYAMAKQVENLERTLNSRPENGNISVIVSRISSLLKSIRERCQLFEEDSTCCERLPIVVSLNDNYEAGQVTMQEQSIQVESVPVTSTNSFYSSSPEDIIEYMDGRVLPLECHDNVVAPVIYNTHNECVRHVLTQCQSDELEVILKNKTNTKDSKKPELLSRLTSLQNDIHCCMKECKELHFLMEENSSVLESSLNTVLQLSQALTCNMQQFEKQRMDWLQQSHQICHSLRRLIQYSTSHAQNTVNLHVACDELPSLDSSEYSSLEDTFSDLTFLLQYFNEFMTALFHSMNTIHVCHQSDVNQLQEYLHNWCKILDLQSPSSFLSTESLNELTLVLNEKNLLQNELQLRINNYIAECGELHSKCDHLEKEVNQLRREILKGVAEQLHLDNTIMSYRQEMKHCLLIDANTAVNHQEIHDLEKNDCAIQSSKKSSSFENHLNGQFQLDEQSYSSELSEMVDGHDQRIRSFLKQFDELTQEKECDFVKTFQQTFQLVRREEKSLRDKLRNEIHRLHQMILQRDAAFHTLKETVDELNEKLQESANEKTSLIQELHHLKTRLDPTIAKLKEIQHHAFRQGNFSITLQSGTSPTSPTNTSSTVFSLSPNRCISPMCRQSSDNNVEVLNGSSELERNKVDSQEVLRMSEQRSPPLSPFQSPNTKSSHFLKVVDNSNNPPISAHSISQEYHPPHCHLINLSQKHIKLTDSQEYEYLRNVMFEYMLGREKQTLTRVICTVLQFSREQTSQVMARVSGSGLFQR